MNHTPKPGTPVWAAMGSYGWSAAIAQTTDKKGVNLRYIDPKREIKNGSRSIQALVLRDPGLNGSDKPKPLGKGD